MFATLLGGLPRPPAPAGQEADLDAAVVAAIRAQEAAGLEPLTDGRLRTPDLLRLAAGLDGVREGGSRLEVVRLPEWRAPLTVAAWQFAAGAADRAVKQSLPGPYTLGRRVDPGRHGLDAVTAAFAEAIREEAAALAAAGCPLVEIEELDAPLIGEDEAERRRFRDAHRRVVEGFTGSHLSLSIVGGSAHLAGAATILAAPYASLAVDLIAGPDNWYLVVATPHDRGIVAGALSPQPGTDDGPELLLWAANYAASTADRGLVRVGLAIAGGLADLDWGAAVRKLERLGEAARIAALPPGDELARSLDPRAIDSRSAALGRYTPKAGRKGSRAP
jgi:methionine synthase II (cobalamin-independent)